MLKVGDKAPAFALYDADKKERNLSEFLTHGKRTILAFYPGAFTGTCTKEMCAFRDMFSDFEKLNGQLVGISVDWPFVQRAFAEKYELKFPLLCDFTRDVIQRYDIVWKDLAGIKGYNSSNRAVFVVDESATIVFAWVAPQPGALPDFDAIKKSLS